MSNGTLVLFCKRPRLGHGKQRLAASLGQQAALALSQGLLACALEELAEWPGPVVISPAAAQDRAWAQALLARDAQVIAQPEGNLGERLEAVDRLLRAQGHEHILIIGSDAPELNPSILRRADQLLRQHEIVLAAAADGGVSLMAAAQPWPSLAKLPWSTAQLGESLALAAAGQGYAVGWTQPCPDVDVAADLERLRVTLAADRRRARQQLLRIIREHIEGR